MESVELLLKAHEKSINAIHLIASENWLSLEARLPYMLDVYSRYVYDAEEIKDDNSLIGQLPNFSGTELLNDLETRCNQLLCELFECKYANVKSLSGLNMMLSVMGSLVLKNEWLLSMPIESGGHSATKYASERLGINHSFIPMIEGTYEVDQEKLKEVVQQHKIKMVYIDLMNVITPIDIGTIRKIVGKSTIICYDASHVLGLIMGDCFQQPLKEGADILIGSAHKTLPGSHKGVFLTNKRWYYMLYKLNHTLFISHTHIADIGAVSMILERGKEFYCDYATRVISNANYLAKIINSNGFTAYSCATHQVWIDCEGMELSKLVNELVNNQIYVNDFTIPHNGHHGIRIGVQEVTLHGFVEEDIQVLGVVICKILNSMELSIELKERMRILIDKQIQNIDKKEKELLELIKDKENCYGKE